ncbi:hypothetical protein [Parasphingorhabdus pacifica]
MAAVVATVAACTGAQEPSQSVAPEPNGRPGEITIVGTVETGVESGCLVLVGGDKPHLLLGGDPAVVRPGAHLLVRGRPDPDLVTTCMQGEPLHVSEANPA